MTIEIQRDEETRSPSNFLYLVLAGALTLLCVIGLIMVASASSVESAQLYGSSWSMLQKQVIAMGFGAFLAYWFSKLTMKWVRIVSWPLMLAALGLLIFTFAQILAGGEAARPRGRERPLTGPADGARRPWGGWAAARTAPSA